MTDDLLERALDGGLDEAEERALAGRLASDPEAARRFMELAREEALLADVAGEARAVSSLRPTAPRWTAVALAASMLLALLGVIVVPRRGPAARVVEVAGDVRLNNRAAKAGDLLYPDGQLATGDGTAVVEFGEARARLLPSGVLRNQSDCLSVGGAVEVEGRLAVRAEEGARVVVRRGTATVNGGLVVPSGHFATARPGRPFAAEPLMGAGLRGEYFAGKDLTDLRFSRVDPTLDFAWPEGRPEADLEPPSFSVRWTGRVVASASGRWTFHVMSDDGARLWVDGRRLVDHWADSTNQERAGAIDLEAWRPVDLRLEYFNRLGPGTVRLAWSGPGTARALIPTSALFPAPAGGTGLSAEYFDGLDFTGRRLVGVDPVIDFHWRLGSPHPSMDPDDFSIRWTGFLVPRHTETYTLTTVSDDGVRLWVDGRPIIDDWTVRGTQERSGSIALTADRRVPVRLEYFDRVALARLSLYWQSPSQPRDLVPQSCLYPD